MTASEEADFAEAAALGNRDGEGGDGSKNLIGGPLKQCSPPHQSSQTGWNRDGSCAWAESDGGYHEVRQRYTWRCNM